MKRAGVPTYKTFEGYEYGHIQFPPLFSREELLIHPRAQEPHPDDKPGVLEMEQRLYR